MKWLSYVIERRIMVFLTVVLIFIGGGYALFNLDQELLPSVTMDGATVEVSAGDISANEVERSITSNLEQRLREIEDVTKVISNTNTGRSSLQLSFRQGKGDEAFEEVESIVYMEAAENELIEDIDVNQNGTTAAYDYFMDISNGDMEEITNFVDETLKPRLESLPEVGAVNVNGIFENEVEIELDREEIDDRSINIEQVIEIIQQQNNDSIIGMLRDEEGSPFLRWHTSLESIDHIKMIQIPTQEGSVTLDEIATVTISPKDNLNEIWKNGSQELIFVQIARSNDITQVELADSVREEIKSINEEGLIRGFEVNEMVSQADYVEDALSGVTINILIGASLAIGILLIFLKNIRATLIIGVSIPTSILLTLWIMQLLDYSFNILTLMGLGLGIGIMVDSSIVILESIYGKKEKGLNNKDAIIQGTKQVASPIVASVITTIVVFLPIGYLEGDIGQLMVMISVVVATTLISSMVISFTVIPTVAKGFLKIRLTNDKKKDGIILGKYSQFISWIVKKKRRSLGVLLTFLLFFVASLTLITKIPMGLMPDMHDRYSEVIVDLDPGLTSDEKELVANQINDNLSVIQDIESNYIMDSGGMFYVMINMTKGENIVMNQEKVNEEIYSSLRTLEETQPILSVQNAMTGGAAHPVQVNIKGEDFDQLKEMSTEFSSKLEEIEGIVGVLSSNNRTFIEEEIFLDEVAIVDAGLEENQIRQIVQQSFLDVSLGDVTLSEQTYPLSIKWNESTTTVSDLLDLEVPTQDGVETLDNFITLRKVEIPNEITREDGERFVVVSADFENTDSGTVNRDVSNLIEEMDVPEGYSISVAGDLEQQQQVMQQMIVVLGVAIFLIFSVMAVQFNHLIHPLFVMSVIPVVITGVILGLFITQYELNVMSGIGIIMLIGISLNNAILLIDKTNKLRKGGYNVEKALVEAGKNRVRPIFMTTLTTGAGMLPLALASGISGNYQAPMAVAIISGLLFSTLVTLLLFPAVYRLFSIERKSNTIKEGKKQLTS
ncbi:efflux RND transporter permease subunit [Shouchella patagoniensis]|uniref:efflux RND transporter permease subunit n=1 Tax=Shouchella patagoniensis TaxID=228576 RepID=UPI0009953616|nr:efflux RND transporter permease subunit [Shouchella patagoniensis]